MDRDTARPIDPKITAAMDSHVRDRDTARTALKWILAGAILEGSCFAEGITLTDVEAGALAGLVLDVAMDARQDVPCETCGGSGKEPGYVAPLGHPDSARCVKCRGSGSVPGPLLIDVMMGRQ